MNNQNPYSYAPRQPQELARPSLAEALPYIRRVYSLFGGGIAFAIGGALIALLAGDAVPVPGTDIEVPPLVLFGIQHWIVMLIVYFAAFMAANFLRRKPGINVVALFGYTFITGLFIAPSLFYAQLRAGQGGAISSSPVLHAFLLTGAAFTGLTAYVFITRKNFSFMGAALNIGLWVLLGALILNIFLHAAILSLAIASVGVLLFAGFILYDTSRILHDREENDAVGAALRLFLDVINMFLMLLRIFGSRR